MNVTIDKPVLNTNRSMSNLYPSKIVVKNPPPAIFGQRKMSNTSNGLNRRSRADRKNKTTSESGSNNHNFNFERAKSPDNLKPDQLRPDSFLEPAVAQVQRATEPLKRSYGYMKETAVSKKKSVEADENKFCGSQ